MNVEYLTEHNGFKPLKSLLTSTHSETVADVLTTFIQAYNYNRTSILNDSQIVCQVGTLKTSENKVISNLANILLEFMHNKKSEES